MIDITTLTVTEAHDAFLPDSNPLQVVEIQHEEWGYRFWTEAMLASDLDAFFDALHEDEGVSDIDYVVYGPHASEVGA